MCEKLALDFASWLDFEINDFIYDTFLDTLNDKLKTQQSQLDYFWDKEDHQDIYGDMTTPNHTDLRAKK